MTEKKSKLIAPWEFTYQEFSRELLFHPVGEPWQPNHTNPLNRPLMMLNDASKAISYLKKSGHLLFVAPPAEYLKEKGIHDVHPVFGDHVIGLSRGPLSTLKDRVGMIPVAKNENKDTKELFPECTALQKWHFTQVVKAFMSGQYVPLKVMLGYEKHLARWAHKQKERHGDRFLRLPHSIARKQHGRDSRKRHKKQRLEAALDDSHLMGTFDEQEQAYRFTEVQQIQREIDARRELNQIQAVDAMMVEQDKPIEAPAIMNLWHQTIDNALRLTMLSRPTF